MATLATLANPLAGAATIVKFLTNKSKIQVKVLLNPFIFDINITFVLFLSDSSCSKSMVYVKGDGTVVERNPFDIFGWFWSIINFFYLLFQTLFNPNFSNHGDKYSRDFRPPGSGPPKPPSRKFGGFGPSGSGPAPPPCGGCGCG